MRCVLSSLTNRPSGSTRRICASKWLHCCGAVEVLEHREAALQQVGAKRLRFAIGEVPEARLPHERDRILEQLGIVERENQAAVGANVERGELLEDQREVLFRARVVVIPRRAEAAAAENAEVGPPAQSHEREPAVVGEIGPVRLARRVRLHGCSHGGAEDDGERGMQPSTHAVIIPDSRGSRRPFRNLLLGRYLPDRSNHLVSGVEHRRQRMTSLTKILFVGLRVFYPVERSHVESHAPDIR